MWLRKKARRGWQKHAGITVRDWRFSAGHLCPLFFNALYLRGIFSSRNIGTVFAHFLLGKSYKPQHRQVQEETEMDETHDGGGGRFIGATATSIDVGGRKEVEEQIELLKLEVNHRAMNLLSVVQAMARQMDRGNNPEHFVARLIERIASLAASHDLLVKSEWQGVDTAELVRRQMAHSLRWIGSRILLDGPPVKLRPFAAQSIGMALHELVSNAAEYGALSGDHGVVRVAWNAANDRSEPLFTMKWSESGGPPVKPPARHGFGCRVLCEITKDALDADIRLDFSPTGFIWQLTAPAERTLYKGAAAGGCG